jgi:hypothetical protein
VIVRARKKRLLLSAGVALGLLAAVAVPSTTAKTVPADSFNLLGPGPTVWDNAVDDYNGGSADVDGCDLRDGYAAVRYGAAYAGHRYRAFAFANGGMFGSPDADLGITPPTNSARYNPKTNTLSIGPVNLIGLAASRSDKPIGHALRTLVKLRNPAEEPFEENLAWDSKLTTAVTVSTSSGDGTQTAADRWVATVGATTQHGYQSLGFSLYGKQAREPVAEVLSDPTAGCVTVNYALSIPAKATRYLLFFMVQETTANAAVNAVQKLDRKTPPSKYLRGIPDKVRSKILNWGL